MAGTRPALKERVWDLLELTEDSESGTTKWDWVDVFLMVLILLSVVVVVLETVQGLYREYAAFFIAFASSPSSSSPSSTSSVSGHAPSIRATRSLSAGGFAMLPASTG